MKRRIALTAVLASLTLATAACGSGDEETATPAAEDTASESSEGTTSEPSEPSETESEDMEETALVGAGCADYAEAVPDGAGSVEGMAQDPVAVAASNNPILTQLTAAVSGGINPDVDLVDTLNGDEFTVFAPVDDAFAALPPETVEALMADADLLSSILTYHVVPGQLAPDEVVGEQTSVQGGTVTVAGEGDTLTVNDANVICGGVQTENATVYLIDEVLDPESGM
jgi:uncharacterized surface protein with fasciclin (FAS1) repeats